MKIVYIYFS